MVISPTIVYLSEVMMEKREGLLIFLQYAKGTKSESLKPYLYENKNAVLPLWKKDDNPFQNDSLCAYDGKHVIIEGRRLDDVFEIENIEIKENGGN